MFTMNLVRVILFLSLLCTACSTNEQRDPATVLNQSWDQIDERGRNQPVVLLMWLGDPYINDYMNKYVKPTVKERFGIDLQISGGQGAQIVQTLVAEREAGQPSQIDMVWINGETFYQLRQIDGLLGPVTDRMPNARYVDFSNPFIGVDFQQPVNGMEVPWGNVQLAFIYDSQRISQPPRSFAELPAYIKAHPGQFTIPNEFTGMTVLKSWMIALSGDPKLFQGKFREDVYEKWSGEVFRQINELKPYFWKRGETFPEQLSTLHQLFANGEVAFTFSNNDAEVDNKVNLGFFPKTARAYVPAPGTIQNTHYMGIIRTGQHPEAAMVVANFLMSPEAQLKKMDPNVWGDHTVLAINKLPADYQTKFNNLPTRRYAPKRDLIQGLAFQEPAPEYMVRLYKDFRTKVIENNK
ncbi:Protein ynjB [Fibrisoma limi BUZ 3]|uniref:Protein ynjB n=2 Tax=Fibrisoma limi TaxID=663275 RepID=I2GJQ4_9BACT|nr:Protein ynjB [Fibrisoma limi BUZ 3]